jgi:hypothetical protein
MESKEGVSNTANPRANKTHANNTPNTYPELGVVHLAHGVFHVLPRGKLDDPLARVAVHVREDHVASLAKHVLQVLLSVRTTRRRRRRHG